MGDESVKKPRDSADVRFSRLEQQVTDINRNLNLLMVALSNKLGIFGEDGGSKKEEKL